MKGDWRSQGKTPPLDLNELSVSVLLTHSYTHLCTYSESSFLSRALFSYLLRPLTLVVTRIFKQVESPIKQRIYHLSE